MIRVSSSTVSLLLSYHVDYWYVSLDSALYLEPGLYFVMCGNGQRERLPTRYLCLLMHIQSEVGRLFINIIEYTHCLSFFQVYIDRKNNFHALSVQAALLLVLVLVSS